MRNGLRPRPDMPDISGETEKTERRTGRGLQRITNH